MNGDSIPGSIDEFRTSFYRVFQASSYFNLDLDYEIRWHEEYLKKLHEHKKNPSSFHMSRSSHMITHERLMHFKEHVIEAIPFHKSIIENNKKRLQTIENLVPKKTYKRLVRISMKYGGTPEYFVFDKLHKKFFFVAETMNEERKNWIKKTKKLTETIVLDTNSQEI